MMAQARDITEAPGLTSRQLSLLRLNPCAECSHKEVEHGSGYLRFGCRVCECPAHDVRDDVKVLRREYEICRQRQRDDEDFAKALTALVERTQGRPERVRAIYEAMAGR